MLTFSQSYGTACRLVLNTDSNFSVSQCAAFEGIRHWILFYCHRFWLECWCHQVKLPCYILFHCLIYFIYFILFLYFGGWGGEGGHSEALEILPRVFVRSFWKARNWLGKNHIIMKVLLWKQHFTIVLKTFTHPEKGTIKPHYGRCHLIFTLTCSAQEGPSVLLLCLHISVVH